MTNLPQSSKPHPERKNPVPTVYFEIEDIDKKNRTIGIRPSMPPFWIGEVIGMADCIAYLQDFPYSSYARLHVSPYYDMDEVVEWLEGFNV